MSEVQVQQIIHYEQIHSPHLVFRSTNRAHSYPTASSVSYRDPIHTRRYRTNHDHLSPESAHGDQHHHISLSKLKGRLVRTTRCESEVNCDYRAPSIQSHDMVYEDPCLSSPPNDIHIYEVSPSRSGFARSPGVSPGHIPHATEQLEYFTTASRQHSPYNNVRSRVRYVSNPDVQAHDRTWSDLHRLNQEENVDVDEAEELRHHSLNYWAQDGHQIYSEPAYECKLQPSYGAYPPAAQGPPRKTTTPTGTIRVNGAIVNAAPTARRSILPDDPAHQSAFYGFNPTPRSQRLPSSTGTGTVLRRGLHRHQQRRHSEGDTDDHIHGPTQDECRQCNGEGCVRSLAMKEYLRKMEQEGGRGISNPDALGPGLRQLMGFND